MSSSTKLIIPSAILACVVSGGIAFYDNQQKTTAMQADSAKQAKFDEFSINQEASYKKLLDVVAKEALVDKTTVVAFEADGNLVEIVKPYPDRARTSHRLKPGLVLSKAFSKSSSTGLYDPYASTYAAIGEVDGRMQVLHTYSLVEVKNQISIINNSTNNKGTK